MAESIIAAAIELAVAASAGRWSRDPHPSLETIRAKAVLLAEYASKPVQTFRQVDCFFDVTPGGQLVMPDEDGYCLYLGTEDGLRFTGPELVRVTIHESITREAALGALKKIVSKIEDGAWETMTDETAVAGSDAHEVELF